MAAISACNGKNMAPAVKSSLCVASDRGHSAILRNGWRIAQTGRRATTRNPKYLSGSDAGHVLEVVPDRNAAFGSDLHIIVGALRSARQAQHAVAEGQ